jgi:peptidoglycan/xylan/chitin deacetylase (PgdA/CDA1 family)
MKNETPVPVLMYHTVGIPDPGWQWRHLTCPYQVFEDQMRWLKRHGFVTVTLSDLYDHIFNGKALPRRSLILTFDDGYSDNWIFAYPILRKYGFKGTVFVNPEFVDRRDVVRKRLDELDPEASLAPEDTRGFLSWNEMAEAEKEGVFDIQGHAMTHTWYPVSEKIVDFRHPGDMYIWMTWNSNVDRKPFLQIDDEALIRWGEPVYEHGKSLSSRRYFPNGELAARLCGYVEAEGGREFFGKADWKGILFERAERIRQDLEPGSYESDNEFRERIHNELSESKRMIEQRLGKTIDFLCWPGGSGSETGIVIAKELGYRMSTAARDMPLSLRNTLSNLPSQRSDRIARTSPILFWDGRETTESRMVYDSGFTLVLNLLAYKRIGFAQIWGRLIRKSLKEYHRMTGRAAI